MLRRRGQGAYASFNGLVFAGSGVMEGLGRDLRQGLRVLGKNPGFTAVIVLTLGLGIGVNTTVFSLLDGMFVPHLAITELDRIALLLSTRQDQGELRYAASIPDFSEWRKQNHVFEEMALLSGSTFTLTDVKEPLRVSGQQVSDGFFRVLGVHPTMGRAFLPEECQPGGNPAAILSDGLWQRAFASAPDILGRTIKLNRQTYTVIGVMPASSSYPPVKTDLWVPLIPDSNPARRVQRFAQAIGRLKPGVSANQAQAEMTTISRRLEQAYPATNTGWGIRVLLLRDDLNKKLAGGIIFLGGPVLFVLLIACANVANLLLARASVRGKEMAVRAALGAGRLRLIRQLLIESLPLGFLGGVFGVFIAYWGMAVVRRLFPDPLSLPPGALRMDLRVFAFALLLSVLTPLFFGIVPAFYSTKLDLNEALKTGGIVGRAGSSSHRLREWLVVVEMMLAVVLLGMCGLFMSIWRWLGKGQPGFDPHNLLTTTISPPDPSVSEVRTFYRRILQRLEAVPGVEAAGLVDHLPMDVGDRDASRSIVIEGGPSAPSQTSAAELMVSPGYFATMHIPLLRGRDFSDEDSFGTPSVALISETLARRCWPNEDPIGKKFKLGGDPQPRTWTVVVGVVADVMNARRDRPPLALVYLPLGQVSNRDLTAVIRTASAPINFLSAVKRAVWEVDKDQLLDDLRTMKEALYEVRQEYVSVIEISGVFAGLALALAAIGVYSVMSYSVAERTAEIGIRMALGARTLDVLRLVIRRGMLLAVSGGVAGLAATWALGRLALSELPELSSSIDVMAIHAAWILVSVAFAASYLPAHRATKVDPMVALRYE